MLLKLTLLDFNQLPLSITLEAASYMLLLLSRMVLHEVYQDRKERHINGFKNKPSQHKSLNHYTCSIATSMISKYHYNIIINFSQFLLNIFYKGDFNYIKDHLSTIYSAFHFCQKSVV